MAGFLKKMFSFGKKEVVETPAEDEKLAPINWDALKELRREDAPRDVAPAVEDVAPASPLAAEVPPQAAEGVAESSGAEPILAQSVPEEAPSTAEVTPSGPSGHLPRKGGEEVAPVVAPEALPAPIEVPAPELHEPASPLAGEVLPQAAEGVAGSSGADPIPAPSVPEEAPSAAEVTPSGPSGHLPRKGGEEAVLVVAPEILPAPIEVPAPELQEPASPLAGEVPPQAAEGVAGSSGADAIPELSVPEEAPSAAATTPSGPAGHLPLEGGEKVAPSRPASGKVTVAKTVAEKAAPAPVAAPEPKLSWFQRLRQGLARSSRELSANISGVFTKRKLDEDTLQELEDVLIRADLGVETALRITDSLASGRYGKQVSDEEVRGVMAEEIGKVLTPVAQALELDLSHKPHVILVVGVNGTGKTTTIGKLAAKLHQGGLSVMLAAGDTFRAAAIEQLKIWGERTNSPVVSSKLGADAAGLAYDAFEQAKAAGSDVLIIDTAGRLQNKAELMAELEKIVRVLGKLDPEAPHTVLQTVDATTGQNALNQVEIFRNVAGVNGLVMTKLDGTARGGILVAIAAKYKLPVYFIGVGEQVDDLEPFSANDFARAIAGVA